MWMAGAGFLTAVTPAYAKGNAFIFLLVVLIDIALWLIVGQDTGWFGDPKTIRPIIGYLLIAAGWIGVYLAGQRFAIPCMVNRYTSCPSHW